MIDERIERFLAEAARGRYSRRELMRRATALGLSAPLVAAAISAAPSRVLAQDTKNPLGVDAAAPLDVVIFKGGYGDDYALNVNKLYEAAYPDAKIKYAGIQRLGEQLRPRFVAGEPPDIIDNSGAENLVNADLVAEESLADLADLMAAPAYGDEATTFKDSLIAGSQELGVYNGKQYVLLYAYTVYGLWHSKKLFDEKGWEVPKTWDEFMTLGETIKGEGIAPMTYQGKYPYYIQAVLDALSFKNGGDEAFAKIDNLEPDAWKQPSVKAAAEAIAQIHEKGFLMEGTEGLTHTESQAEWLQNKAAFIPCGNWLENEMKDLTPEGFDMVVTPTPSLTGDKLPFEGIEGYAGENFIVPSQGKNVQGGKEWARMLFSKEGARFFSENTKALTVVLGATEGLDLGVAFKSVEDVLAASGQNVFSRRYNTWYAKLATEAENQCGALINGRITPQEYMDKVQAAADAVAKDDSIPKYKREV